MKAQVEHATRSSRVGVVLIAVGLIVLALAPYWGDRITLRLLAEIFTYVALASLWNLLAGYAGLVSVGQQAYVGLGGYILFALAILFGVHPIVAILIAGPMSALISVPVACLCFACAAHTLPSVPGWWRRCSACSPRRSPCSAEAPASVCRLAS
jgi:branched-chain amino acid transport system permease protein